MELGLFNGWIEQIHFALHYNKIEWKEERKNKKNY